MQVGEGQQVQIVQAATAQGQAQTAQAQGQTMQVMQQIITNTGEIQQIPVRNDRMEKEIISFVFFLKRDDGQCNVFAAWCCLILWCKTNMWI